MIFHYIKHPPTLVGGLLMLGLFGMGQKRKACGKNRHSTACHEKKEQKPHVGEFARGHLWPRLKILKQRTNDEITKSKANSCNEQEWDHPVLFEHSSSDSQ
jgi:hypothetical protein